MLNKTSDVMTHDSSHDTADEQSVHGDSQAAVVAAGSAPDGSSDSDGEAAERERIAELVEYYRKHGCWGPLTSSDSGSGAPGGAQGTAQGAREELDQTGSDQVAVEGHVIQGGSDDVSAGDGMEDVSDIASQEEHQEEVGHVEMADEQGSNQQQQHAEPVASGAESGSQDAGAEQAYAGSQEDAGAAGQSGRGPAGSSAAAPQESTWEDEQQQKQQQQAERQTEVQQCSTPSNAASTSGASAAAAAAWPDPYATGTCKHVPLTVS
jgi:hypothetical protein